MNRIDICEVYYLLETDFNVGGWLHERKSNVRRGLRRGYTGESTSVQLRRMCFTARPSLSYDTLSEEQKELYHTKCLEYGFTEQLLEIDSIQDIQVLPQAILVDRDYDVAHLLANIGLLRSNDDITESETLEALYNQEYQGCFVLLDKSGADYLAVWGFSVPIPYLSKSLDLLWLGGKLIQ